MTGASDSTHLRLPRTVRVAALLFVCLGVAFGASVPFVLAHLDRYGELPMMFGFRSMGGPFEQFGPRAFSALGWTFVWTTAVHRLGVSVFDIQQLGGWSDLNMVRRYTGQRSIGELRRLPSVTSIYGNVV